MFLDRIQGRTGHHVRDHQRGRGEPPRLPGGAADARAQRGASRRVDAARRGRRRQHEPDAAPAGTAESLRRLRARRGAAAPAAQPAAAHATTSSSRCSSARSRTSSRRSGCEIPLEPRHAHDRDRRRRPVRGVADPRERDRRRRARDPARRVPRVLRLRSSGWTRSSWSIDSACRPSRPRRSCRRCSSTGRCCRKRRPPARRLRRVAAGRRAARPGRARRPAERRGLRAPGAGQRRGARASVPLRPRARPPRRDARDPAVRRAAGTSTASPDASGCCCRSPRCCTTSASTSACARTTSTRSTCWRRSQIFGLSDDETAIVSNIARYHRRGLPQHSHLPYIALDRQDRLIVNKLAAILRVANALDAEHLQKVAGRPARCAATPTWILEARRRRRPDDGAAGGDRARRHVRRNVRPAARSSGRSECSA